MQNITLTIFTAMPDIPLYFRGMLYSFVYDYGETGRVLLTSFHLASYSLRRANRATISVSTGHELSVASILMFLAVDPKADAILQTNSISAKKRGLHRPQGVSPKRLIVSVQKKG